MRKRGDVAYLILKLLGAVGLVTALLVAPGLGVALKLIDPNPRKAIRKADRALERLVKSGKVVRTKNGYRITTKGDIELARQKFDRYQFPSRSRWDKKFRVICFDVPEKKRYVRRILHGKLKELGCFPLQDSVFITPHPCGEFLKLAQDSYQLKNHLRGMIVTRLVNEHEVLSFFALSR